MATEQRNGYKSRQHALTLTFREPMSFSRGMIILASYIRRYNFVDYVFYPEWTEQGNLHFHGTIWEKNIKQYGDFKFTWSFMYGFTKEKPIRPPYGIVGWHLYCRKDQHEVRYKKFMRVHKYNSKHLVKQMVKLRLA